MAKERVVAGVHASRRYIPSCYSTAIHGFDFCSTGLIGLRLPKEAARRTLYFTCLTYTYHYHRTMFSDAPHHASVYGYYDQLVEAEKQSYQTEKTDITTAQQIQEELKELHQETASLAYLCQCITGTSYYSFSVLDDALLCRYSANAKVSTGTVAPHHSIDYHPKA
ncbi:hypothetical protein ARMSODRAFT_547277 [Armillaria solidipes]|uniref:Uncharacterized protein n=1 Tax=Armillaria solidipes TaxID=1076256 RepID=A0A2H3AX48_9AGAR|nr:hypothetical protein ARMSODRAFT_547277 [Armillaria solidipes]